MPESKNVRIIDETVIAKGKGTVTSVTYEHRTRSGEWRRDHREIYDNGNSAVILPYDSRRKKILLTRQLRIPVFLQDGADRIIEACAGKLQGKAADVRIIMEAEEELGYRLTNPQRLFDLFMSPASFMEKITFFLCTYSPADKISEGGGLSEEGEDIEVLEFLLDDALQMIETNAIADAKTVILIQALVLKLARQCNVTSASPIDDRF